MTQKKPCSWLSRLFNNSFNFPSLEKDFRAQQYDYNIRAKANYMAHFFLHDTVSSEVAGRAKYTLSDSLLCLLFWNSSLALRKTKSAVASKLVCWNGLFVFCNQHDCMKTLIVLILKCMYEENRNRRRQYEKKKRFYFPSASTWKDKECKRCQYCFLAMVTAQGMCTQQSPNTPCHYRFKWILWLRSYIIFTYTFIQSQNKHTYCSQDIHKIHLLWCIMISELII